MIRNEELFNKNLPANFDGKFEWDFLNPIFSGTSITPMDIDCVMERNGHLFVIETKKVGAEIPMGQRITYRSLHKRGGVTLMYAWLKTNENNEKNSDSVDMLQILQPNSTTWDSFDFEYTPTVSGMTGTQLLYTTVSNWYNYANNNNYYNT